ncbi:MAG TPA: hypothetical protein VE262_23220 [Blastocatellia bacterium]|nr:hypothetical protein [Blastocatellia bacterium]
MGSIVFVHGTGVRSDSYKMTFKKLRQGVESNLPAWTLVPCCWGEEHGAKLRKQGASIPDFEQTGGLKAGLSGDEDLALWKLLYDDPLYELKLLASVPGEEGVPLLGGASPALELRDKVEGLEPPAQLWELLEYHLLDAVWGPAFDKVRTSSALDEALAPSRPAGGEERAAIARAITAQAIALAAEQGIPSVDSRSRDRIVDFIIDELGGGDRGLRQWMGDKMAGLAMKVGTSWASRKRGAISEAASPLAGDVILYQTRGESLREFVREKIESAPPPVFVLAHSLGGVVCVDLLAMEKMDVSGLITVGSQAPLLYEIDSLTGLRHDSDLPAHFPKWLNFYDPHDFLSYVGAALFPGRVEDVKVESDQPFPESHSAYWSSDRFWKRFTEFVG